MTSGAIQNGVPTKVFFFVIVADNCPETPKSASLTCPFAPSKTFAAFVQKLAKTTKRIRQHLPTFDISVELLVPMKVVQAEQQFAYYDRNIFLSN